MEHEKLIEKLKAFMDKQGSIRAANMLGYDASFLRKVADGVKPMPDGLVTALGYEKVVKYRRVK